MENLWIPYLLWSALPILAVVAIYLYLALKTTERLARVRARNDDIIIGDLRDQSVDKGARLARLEGLINGCQDLVVGVRRKAGGKVEISLAAGVDDSKAIAALATLLGCDDT